MLVVNRFNSFHDNTVDSKLTTRVNSKSWMIPSYRDRANSRRCHVTTYLLSTGSMLTI